MKAPPPPVAWQTWPVTWQAVTNVIAATREALGDSPDAAHVVAVKTFDGVLLGGLHPACNDRTARARRRRERTELAPTSIRQWIAVAIGAAYGDVELLDENDLFPTLDARTLRADALLKKAPDLRAAAPGRVARIVNTVGTAIAVATQRKSQQCKKKGLARAASGDVDASTLGAWFTEHPRIHLPSDATFVRERIDEIEELVERTLKRGDAERLVDFEPAIEHHLHVLERHDLRLRLARAVSGELETGRLRRSRPVQALHALVEGEGMYLIYGGKLDELRARILDPAALGAMLQAAEQAVRDGAREADARLLTVTRAVLARLEGLAADRAGEPLHRVTASLRAARRHAEQAANESLVFSITVDLASARRRRGDLDQALVDLLDTIPKAQRQGNHRRLFRLYREQAYTWADIVTARQRQAGRPGDGDGAPRWPERRAPTSEPSSPRGSDEGGGNRTLPDGTEAEHRRDLAHDSTRLFAATAAIHARETLDTIDLVCDTLLGGRVPTGWYQPSFRKELADLEAYLRERGLFPDVK